ncbi:MAG TPA: DAK2 domain-containing protein, partial [Lachnospiraceae bacterium]|nr:DAK2 domain-containing protein [Lachnospiraceae bacterium]
AQLVSETNDLIYFSEEVLKYMQVVLDQTPDMLPVLKEAGVVDSGGQGLLEVLKGAFDAMIGKEVDVQIEGATSQTVQKKTEATSSADIKFGYCTEFIIMLEKDFKVDTEHEFKSYLESIGDSIVVVSDDDIVKVHVHTNDPGLAIQRALTYGSLTSMKIDNMREEHNERLIKDAEKASEIQAQEAKPKKEGPMKEVGFISVSIGEGINEIFTGLGVDYLIEGGQTMNPSTEDMLNAIEQVNAKTIFILPNNKNIILAAEQAKQLTEDKEIIVIPTKTIPQGITAVINFVYDKTPEENMQRMVEEIAKVKSGQVTYAVRDTSIDGKEIRQGNIMGIGDSSILSVGSEIDSTTLELVDCLVDDNSELISLYYGNEINEDDATNVANQIMEKYPDVDVEVHLGGQPIYYYVLSVE